MSKENPKEPLVSVIIPCYNSEKYISETLDSVINQAYKNWECIVVDDHSTDNSIDIVQEYCKKHDNIKSLINPRKGAPAARNFGLENVRGEYIQFLDSDDLLSENKILKQVNCLKENDVQIVYGEWHFFYNNTLSKYNKKYPLFKQFNTSLDLILYMWNMDLFIASHSYLISTKLLKDISWNEKLIRNQDGEYFLRLLLKAKKVSFVKNSDVFYRRGIDGSISTTISHEKIYSAYLSYLSYKKEILAIENSNRVKKALSGHFSGLIYRHYKRYPDIAEKAFKELDILGVKPKPSGGKLFNFLSNIFGFNNAIKFRYLFKK